MAYEPKSAVKDKDYELYNVVYTAFTGDGKTINDVDLMDYHANRNSFRWTPFRRKKTDGGFEFIACPYISEQSYPTWSHDWLNDTEYEDKNIYSFIQDKTFTLIIYDSRDYDSVLTKDIVVKQYQTGYHRDTEDWKKDGVVIYDVADDSTDYPTYESTCFFDLNCLKESKVDEVFLCGYNIPANMVRQFAQSGERVFVFENNPFKINAIRSILRAQYDVKLCVSKISTKAYQAYSLFRDPIGNIKPEDNKGLKILKDYSNAITNSFTDYKEWQYLEKVKKAFEIKVKEEDEINDDGSIKTKGWRSQLVDILFGAEPGSFDLTLSETTGSVSEFMNDLENKKLLWVGDVVAINTENTPTFAEVDKLIHIDRKYSQILTFYKNNADFWTVNIYKTERELLNPISCVKAETKNAFGVQNIWYTPTGIPVVKVEDFYQGRISAVKWYNVSGKRSIPVNNYVIDNNKYEYVFDTDLQQYVKFDAEKYRAESLKSPNVTIHYAEDIYCPFDLLEETKPTQEPTAETEPTQEPTAETEPTQEPEQKVIKKRGDVIKNPYMVNNKLQTYSLSKDNSNLVFNIVYPDTIDIDFNKISLIDMLRNKYYCQGNKYVVTCSLTDKQMYECLKTKSIMG